MRVLTPLYLLYALTIIAVYGVRKRMLVVAVLGAAVLLVPVSVMAGIGIGQAVYIFCVMMAGAILIRTAQRLVGLYGEYTERSIEEKGKLNALLDGEKKDLFAQHKLLDEKSFMIGKVYEIIKAMSGLLRCDEIVYLFSVFINEHFYFTRCRLFIFDQEKETGSLKTSYMIRKGTVRPEDCGVGSLSPWLQGILDYIKKRKYRETITLDDALHAEYGIPRDVKRLDLIPLTVENRMVAAIAVEDLEEAQVEYVMLLVSQLGMELKTALLYAEVERRSVLDGLTGIYLRRYFLDRTVEEMQRSERMKLKFSILMLDIDKFKKCNDTYGHMVGDMVLRVIAQTIKESIRELDLVARYGGEEFSVILPDTGEHGALYVSERIRAAIEAKTITAYDETVKVTVSIGISIYPDHGSTINQLLSEADSALYLSKQKGRNRVTLFKAG
ncbi:MAG: sensor domain-containing diguanylate cyclase [Candidatus Omnitrophica bacterium]|nr:sensor domain-containing diguanylate cyclase [Candidatus Omnitrophota bacterium]